MVEHLVKMIKNSKKKIFLEMSLAGIIFFSLEKIPILSSIEPAL